MSDEAIATAAPAPEAPPRSTIRAVTCPNCGGTVQIRVEGTSISVICEHCGSTLDASRPDLQVIARANAALEQPQIRLGTRGVLDGTTWETVGYMERTDDEVDWGEYLLFNPYEGYAFLVDDGRRFSLGRLLDRLPTSNWGLGLQADGLSVSRFGTTYPVRVTFVVGEFYWRVKVGETVKETDFVCPGTMIACEDSDEERTWTRLDMLDWGIAETAFGIPKRRQEYSNPAPHEPSPWRARMGEAWVMGIVAAFLLLLVSMAGGGETQVAATNTDVVLDGPEKTIVIHVVDLPRARNRVAVAAAATGLDNAWVDIDYSLTNPKTQDSIDAYGLAEFYEGSDSDGHWTEGDTRPGVTMSSVPAGRYDLVVTLQAHKWNGSGSSTTTFGAGSFGSFGNSFAAAPSVTIPVAVSVKSGGVFGGNILLGLFAIFLWPIIVMFRHFSFEKRRKAPVTESDE
jgi:ribosomal protein S27E